MAAVADDPGSTPDATGRRLAYLPAALLGNGSLLVTLSGRGDKDLAEVLGLEGGS